MLPWLKSNRSDNGVEGIIRALEELGPITSIDESHMLSTHLSELCQSMSTSRSRALLLRFLRGILDPKSDWKDIENGLRILGALARNGADEIFREISRGMHFDVNQRTILLMSYSHDDDRITRLIRSSALVVHKRLLERMSKQYFVPLKPEDEFGIGNEDAEFPPPPTRAPVMTPDTSPTDLIDL